MVGAFNILQKGRLKMAKKEEFKVVEKETAPVRDIKAELQAEADAIREKAEKLQAFTQSEDFKALPYAERRLIAEQFNILASYLDCLTARMSIKG